MGELSSLYILAVSKIDTTPLPQSAANEPKVQVILGIVFGIVGAICLLIITISGLRYILSAGDPQKASQAKEGLIYALVGLAVVVAAQGIATFVLGRL
jgi:hypothetical protein